MNVRDLWYGRTFSAKVLRLVLLPFSALYWLGWQIYLAAYRFGLKRGYRSYVPILAVGNFTVGGSGKSPVALEIARILREKGWQVVIGCSGYGSPRAEAATLAPEGPLDPAEWGDEPSMIRSLEPEMPLIVGRRRVLAAQIAEERFPEGVLVMDDGLQHLPIAIDLRIALDDPEAPNRFVLPAGPYREPVHPSRYDLLLPGRFHIERAISSFVDLDGSAVPVEAWSGKSAHALAGIALPERFFGDLRNLGIALNRSVAVPDHDPLTAGTLLDSFEPEIPLIVSSKDWVKLSRRNDIEGRTIWIAQQSVSIEPRDEFADWLHATTQEIAQKKVRR